MSAHACIAALCAHHLRVQVYQFLQTQAGVALRDNGALAAQLLRLLVCVRVCACFVCVRVRACVYVSVRVYHERQAVCWVAQSELAGTRVFLFLVYDCTLRAQEEFWTLKKQQPLCKRKHVRAHTGVEGRKRGWVDGCAREMLGLP